MPLAKYRTYAVHFSLPDREHLAHFRSIDVTGGTENEKKWLTREAMRSLAQNPDAQVIDIIPLDIDNPFEHLAELAKELDARFPDQPGAHALGLDTPNRILTDIEIPRSLAAQKIPGGARLNTGFLTLAGRNEMAAEAASPRAIPGNPAEDTTGQGPVIGEPEQNAGGGNVPG